MEYVLGFDVTAGPIKSAGHREDAMTLLRTIVPLAAAALLFPAAANAQAITMISRNGQPLAKPSSLGADGASFSVTRS